MSAVLALAVPPCCVAELLRRAQSFLCDNSEALELSQEIVSYLEHLPIGEVSPEEREQWQNLRLTA
jgi:hypothetical protein